MKLPKPFSSWHCLWTKLKEESIVTHSVDIESTLLLLRVTSPPNESLIKWGYRWFYRKSTNNIPAKVWTELNWVLERPERYPSFPGLKLHLFSLCLFISSDSFWIWKILLSSFWSMCNCPLGFVIVRIEIGIGLYIVIYMENIVM